MNSIRRTSGAGSFYTRNTQPLLSHFRKCARQNINREKLFANQPARYCDVVREFRTTIFPPIGKQALFELQALSLTTRRAAEPLKPEIQSAIATRPGRKFRALARGRSPCRRLSAAVEWRSVRGSGMGPKSIQSSAAGPLAPSVIAAKPRSTSLFVEMVRKRDENQPCVDPRGGASGERQTSSWRTSGRHRKGIGPHRASSSAPHEKAWDSIQRAQTRRGAGDKSSSAWWNGTILRVGNRPARFGSFLCPPPAITTSGSWHRSTTVVALVRQTCFSRGNYRSCLGWLFIRWRNEGDVCPDSSGD